MVQAFKCGPGESCAALASKRRRRHLRGGSGREPLHSCPPIRLPRLPRAQQTASACCTTLSCACVELPAASSRAYPFSRRPRDRPHPLFILQILSTRCTTKRPLAGPPSTWTPGCSAESRYGSSSAAGRPGVPPAGSHRRCHEARSASRTFHSSRYRCPNFCPSAPLACPPGAGRLSPGSSGCRHCGGGGRDGAV